MSRLIRSNRAGVGKSLQKFNLCTKLRAKHASQGKDITIPIYKTVDVDGLIKRLTGELDNGFSDDLFHTIHLDIAHEVSAQNGGT